MAQHKCVADTRLVEAIGRDAVDRSSAVLAAALDIMHGLQVSPEDGSQILACARLSDPVLAQNIKMRARLKELGEDWEPMDTSVTNGMWKTTKPETMQ